MKKLKYLSLPFIALAFFSLISCGPDDPETPAWETVKDRLTATWGVDESKSNQVVFSGEDRTDSYSNFAITVTAGGAGEEGGNYTTTNVDEPDPWPANGSWSFTNVDNITDPNASSFTIERGDGVIVNVSNLSDTEMTLEFSYDQATNADDDNRINEVDGQWTFVLTRQ